MTIEYKTTELNNMLKLGVSDFTLVNNRLLLTPEVASYYEYMKTRWA